MEPTLPHSLVERANQADWEGMLQVLSEMEAAPLPHTSAAIHDRARTLEAALTAARSVRADLASSLMRVNAAVRFNDRQNFGGSANP